MGDFNAIMQPGDRSGGDIHWPSYQDDFNKCISHSELLQVPYVLTYNVTLICFIYFDDNNKKKMD